MRNEGKKWIVWGCTFILLASIFVSRSADLTQDLGRHIRLGEIIVQTGSVPNTNLLSYTNRDFPFVNHHWLFEVLVYWGERFLGIPWLIMIKAFMLGASVLIAVTAAHPRSLRTSSLFVLLLLSPLFLERSTIRPEIFGYILFALMLRLVYDAKKYNNLSYFVPLLLLLWVNTHISFIFGIILFALQVYYSHKNRRTFVITALTLISLCINPNGLTGVLYPLSIFRNYGYTIVEVQSLFFLLSVTSDVLLRYFIVMLGVTIIVFFFLLFYKQYVDLLILLMFAVASVAQIRHLPFFLLVALAVFPTIMETLTRSHHRTALTQRHVNTGRAFIILMCLLYIAMYSSSILGRTYDLGSEFGVSYALQGDGLLRFLRKENAIKGRLFNNFDIGGYLSYALYPQHSLFVDNRPEAYPAEFFRQTYIPLQQDENIQKKQFNTYGIKTVIFAHADQTPWGRTFLQRILADKQWKLVFLDAYAVVLVEDDEALDLRLTNEFGRRQIAEANRYEDALRYALLFDLMQREDLSDEALQKAGRMNPTSCSIARYMRAAVLINEQSGNGSIRNQPRPPIWCFE